MLTAFWLINITFEFIFLFLFMIRRFGRTMGNGTRPHKCVDTRAARGFKSNLCVFSVKCGVELPEASWLGVVCVVCVVCAARA